MLNSINKFQSTVSATNVIPDPWDLTKPVISDLHRVAIEIPKEEHLLISSSSKANAKLIAPPKPHPEQTLLQDWLKLKTDKSRELGGQLQQALGLLYWVEGVT